MKFRHYLKLLAFCISGTALAVACASIQAPTGGPRDELGPVLESTDPEANVLRFEGRQIVFTFDEFLKPGNYGPEIFVSPIPENHPKVTVVGKKLFVRFVDPLLENTTYVITIGKDIKDSHEGKPMTEPIDFAFSTGAQLDSMLVLGSVINPQNGKGEGGITVLLYPAEEVKYDSIWKRKPLYATVTDDGGTFKLQHLAKRDYKIYGVKDDDKSYTYSSFGEKLALAEDPLVVFDEEIVWTQKELYSFNIDLDPPSPRSYKWINNFTMVVDFKEKIKMIYGKDTLKAFLADTVGNEPEKVSYFHPDPGDPKRLLLYANRLKREYSNLKFINLIDSLGNKIDTMIRIDSAAISDNFDKNLFFPVQVNQEDNAVVITSKVPFRPYQQRRNIAILDSVGYKLPFSYKVKGYEIRITSEEAYDPKKKYRVQLSTDIEFRGGRKMDSLVTFDFKPFISEQLGGISGKINEEEYPGDWIVLLLDESDRLIRQSKGEKFNFPNLSPGNYYFQLINDRDGNGCWSPGSLRPYRLPESKFFVVEPIEIRGKWEIEDHIIKPVKTLNPVKFHNPKLDEKALNPTPPKKEPGEKKGDKGKGQR